MGAVQRKVPRYGLIYSSTSDQISFISLKWIKFSFATRFANTLSAIIPLSVLQDLRGNLSWHKKLDSETIFCDKKEAM